ncbi:MAG: pancreas/duodenum homeobox protein 1 [Deltaproteobacteria bacterium]
MSQDPFAALFTAEVLEQLFPEGRANDFFEALFGDAAEGAYDIRLVYRGYDEPARTLAFALQLHQRPGKCLACNLTYGLPEVFSRHPLIDLSGLTKEIDNLLGELGSCAIWRLGTTEQVSSEMHRIPFLISLA